MKKKIKKAVLTDSRKDWKNDVENEIMTMQEEMDELADELNLSEETILKLEKIVDKFKASVNEAINLFTITPEDAAKDEYFVGNLLDEIAYERIAIGPSELEQMIDITNVNCRGKFVKTDSLASEIRLKEFIETLEENPYQLKLIA